jgi:hypothetical protein
MNGWHRDTASPDGKAIRDQPIAQTGNELADMFAPDSLVYKPLNMIVNFGTSTWAGAIL